MSEEKFDAMGPLWVEMVPTVMECDVTPGAPGVGAVLAPAGPAAPRTPAASAVPATMTAERHHFRLLTPPLPVRMVLPLIRLVASPCRSPQRVVALR